MNVEWKERLEALEERVARMEGRQFELATRVATLAVLISESALEHREKPTAAKVPSRAVVEHYREMQALAVEIGDLFGSTRAEFAEIRARMKTPPGGYPAPPKRSR